MYIDLIRVYLRDYGPQAELAETVGVTGAYLSYMLTPPGGRRDVWHDVLHRPEHELDAWQRFAKTPSLRRARQITAELHLAGDRRGVLLDHIRYARRAAAATTATVHYATDMVDSAIHTIGTVHSHALNDPDPGVTRLAYQNVWLTATAAAPHIDPSTHTVPYVQALMFLHDAASVHDRHDLALGFARTAQLAIRCHGRPRQTAVNRFRLNALLAETVSLNNLGLHRDALHVARLAESQPDYDHDPTIWRRSFLEQQLSALILIPRSSIYQTERIAADALDLASADAVLQAGIVSRLADGYLNQGSARSVRKSGNLLPALTAAIDERSTISPLRRVRVLRTLASFYRHVHDHDTACRYTETARTVARQANLSHQHRIL